MKKIFILLSPLMISVQSIVFILVIVLFSCGKEKKEKATNKDPRLNLIGKYEVRQTKVFGGMYYKGIFTYVKDTVVSVNLGSTHDTYSILGEDKAVGNHIGNCSSYSHNDLYLLGDSIYYYVTCEGLGGYTKVTLEGHKISSQP